ncbi:MAG: hypothetical protein GY838_07100 [bacterium]|nr:hypothetical protein [bacterium]
MQRAIQILALGAALLVVVAGIWQSWALVTTLKRLVLAYLAFFFLGSVGALSVRAGALFGGGGKEGKERRLRGRKA